MDGDANLLNPKAEAFLPVGSTAVGKSGATAKVKGIARRTESGAPTPAASEPTPPTPTPAAPLPDTATVLDDYDRARREIFEDGTTADALDEINAPSVPAEGRKKVALRGSVDKGEEGQFDRRVVRGRGRGANGFRGGRGGVDAPYHAQYPQHQQPGGPALAMPYGAAGFPHVPAPYNAAPGPHHAGLYPHHHQMPMAAHHHVPIIAPPHPMSMAPPTHPMPMAPPVPMPQFPHFAQPQAMGPPYISSSAPGAPSIPAAVPFMAGAPSAPFLGRPLVATGAPPPPQPYPSYPSSVPGFVPPALPPGAQLTPAQWEHLMKAAGGPRSQ